MIWILPAVLALGAVAAVLLWKLLPSGVALTALSVDGAGDIAPDTAFELRAKPGQDPDALRETILTEPEMTYDLAETESGVYLLTPLRPLDAGADIVFTVGKKTFPFRVQNTLLVLSAFPADGGRYVPVNSGVEFTFNTRNLTQEEFKAAFTITPDVKGYFYVGDKRYAFYPEEGFAYGTEYTVTLSADMKTADGAALGEERRFTFTTIAEIDANLRHMFQLAGGVSANSLSSEIPLVQAYIDQSVADPEQSIGVTLHSYAGWEDYLDAMQRHTTRTAETLYDFFNEIDLEGLPEYAAFEVQPLPLRAGEDDGSGQWVLQFPEALPEGWYVATFSLEINEHPVQRQMFLQVSDLSVFYMAYDQDLLVWVNDAATGGPVADAQVELAGTYRAKGLTGEDGTARITDGRPPDEEDRDASAWLTVKAGERAFVDTSIYYSYYGDGADISNQYMSYLFTDRPVYHTTDTIQVWGSIRARVGGTPLPDDLRLVLGEDILTEAVTPLPNGTFTATVAVDSLPGDTWPSLRLMTGENELFNITLRFEDFVKPVYTAVTEPERPVSMVDVGDSIRVGLDVSTFDGTPVSNFAVRASGGESDGELRTDSRGHIDTAVRVNEGVDTWYPQSYYYQFYSEEAQDEGFYLYGNVYGIHRDVMLRAAPDLASGGSKVEVTTHRIDTSRVQSPEQVWERDILKGAALSQTVRATVNKVYYEKIKTGVHYDFVNRVTVDSFRYERREEVVDSREFATVNGGYTLEDLPVSDQDACYFVVLETDDSQGRNVRITAYLGDLYSRYGSSDNGTHTYTLVKQTDPEYAEMNESGGDVYMEQASSQFDDGESAEFLLLDNDLPLDGMQGRLLYGVVQDRFSNIAVTDAERFTLPFADSLLPNYLLTGAYFDGKHVFALENTYMNFNARRRELEIALDTDKESYRPADPLRVDATVTNAYTGKPAADTAVVLSVVDEAVFAIQEQYPNILQRIYAAVYYPYIRKYTSYLQLDMGGPGEKGGGGGENMRTEFEDTAYFATGTTDSAGKVTFDCQLPDNITSWRLTSLAISPENHAGNTKTNVAATKEFFILPVVNDTLLEGDSFAVGVYGTGAEVADSDTVRYSVTVEGGAVKETKEMSATLREYAGAQFGALPEGDYTVTIEAECGAYKDGVRLPFTVVKSGVEVSLVKTFDLADGVAVDSLRYPVSISFYGKDMKTYNTVFQSVYAICDGGRADMRLGRRYAAQQFQKQGAGWYNSSILEDDYSDLGGFELLSIYPYSEQDLEFTAKARLALPEMVSLQSLRGQDAVSAADAAGAKSAVYLANALAEEPLTANVQSMLQSGGDLGYVDKMYLALALALSGDTEHARDWYDQLVKPNLSELTGLAGDTALYVNLKDAARSQGDCTAAASLLATALATDEAPGLARWLAEKKSAYEPYIFEQIYFLRQNEPAGGGVSFEYTRDGKTETVTPDSGFTSLSFTRAQLAEAAFRVKSGEVYADVYYAGAPEAAADEGSKKIGLTKRIEAVDGDFAVGGLVRVTLTPDFSALDADIGDTMLVVDDYIPTGMRFERYDHDFSRYEDIRGWYLNSRQGQRLQYTIYGVGRTNVKPIVYYARCSTPGEYVVESAYITSATGDTWGASERTAVTVQ